MRCAPLYDNFLMSELLRYGVRDANKKKRIAPTQRHAVDDRCSKTTSSTRFRSGYDTRAAGAGPPPAVAGEGGRVKRAARGVLVSRRSRRAARSASGLECSLQSELVPPQCS